jgi:transposase InsO family protein
MAIKKRKRPNEKLIPPSDRGFQYCNLKYNEFAENNDIMISMTEQYRPNENAIAESFNRTLKYELRNCIRNTNISKQFTKQAVYIYNNVRTHFRLNLRKPAEVRVNPNLKYKSYPRNNVNLTELTI